MRYKTSRYLVVSSCFNEHASYIVQRIPFIGFIIFYFFIAVSTAAESRPNRQPPTTPAVLRSARPSRCIKRDIIRDYIIVPAIRNPHHQLMIPGFIGVYSFVSIVL